MSEVESYVKNAFLGFSIPYTADGRERQYFPDYIARIKTQDDNRFNLLIEITGFSKDKTFKRWYVKERWLPAVNATRRKLGQDPWYFIEITDIECVESELTENIQNLATDIDDQQLTRDLMWFQLSSMESVWDNDDDKLFDRL